MATILHLSDLHRTSGPRLANDELIAALASDAHRWTEEGIPLPDLVVVSGDLVQGAKLGDTDFNEVLDQQYNEAGNFLSLLAGEFLNGDHGRIVLVPGNHDVSWNDALAAMSPTDEEPPASFDRISIEPGSGLRWNWRDRQALRIVDEDAYQRRLERFRRFRSDFYGGSTRPVVHSGDIVASDFPELGLVVVGFASWHGNDCFCEVGEIDSSDVAKSREIIQAANRSPIALAVWHHSVRGGPRSRDYMDDRVLHRLVDFGFSVGMHGHQHSPDAAPFELKLPNSASMLVVGAGSIAVGDRELPMGEKRQFNLVEVDADNARIRVHVRAMSREGVFMGSHRDDWGGRTYVEFPLPATTRSGLMTPTKALDDALAAIAAGQYGSAQELLDTVGPEHSDAARQARIEICRRSGDTAGELTILKEPRNADELFRAVQLLQESRQYPAVDSLLDRNSELAPADLVNEARNRNLALRTSDVG